MIDINTTSRIDSVKYFNNNELGISLDVLRIDLIHPFIGGNKWFKLKHNLIKAKTDGYNKVLTFGGAYSNHIYSTAAAGKLFGLNTIGVIRGEEHLPLNPTLSFAKKMEMEIIYLSRSDYRKKNDPSFLTNLKKQYGNIYIIPEGGTNLLGVKGASEILENVETHYDFICVPCGTGGTISGIISSDRSNNSRIIGFPVLKGAGFLEKEIKNMVKKFTGKDYNNWQINLDYHFGGYAKITKELIIFMRHFKKITDIMLDPIYTGKMFYGISDLIMNNYFPKESKILAIHTGGLQGRNGMHYKL